MPRFFFISTYGEMLDVALHLQDVEGHEVKMWITDRDHARIGKGLIPHEQRWWRHLDDSWTFFVDGCENGDLQDWLRQHAVRCFGGSAMSDHLENNRQAGQELFKRAGFYQPTSKNFTSIDDAIAFVHQHMDRLWILKQNGDAPKSLNHAGHFQDNADMLWHLESLKKRWNETQFGQFDCDLMEQVEGLELACSAYFNGHDFMRNSKGRVVAFLNFEEKKEADGGLGETCGEMGTTFLCTTDEHPLVQEILMRPPLIEAWRTSGIRGIVDVNCIQTDRGLVALEETNRPGVPSSSYEFLVATRNFGDVAQAVACGTDTAIEANYGWGMVMVIAAKPFPVEADMDEEATSVGEKLWILKNGKPTDEFSSDQRRRIHLENFYRDEEGNYLVATKNGYLCTATGHGDGIARVREELIHYIKDNLYIAGMKFRTDIGKRVESYEADLGRFIPRREVVQARQAPRPTLGY